MTIEGNHFETSDNLNHYSLSFPSQEQSYAKIALQSFLWNIIWHCSVKIWNWKTVYGNENQVAWNQVVLCEEIICLYRTKFWRDKSRTRCYNYFCRHQNSRSVVRIQSSAIQIFYCQLQWSDENNEKAGEQCLKLHCTNISKLKIIFFWCLSMHKNTKMLWKSLLLKNGLLLFSS